MGSEITIFDPLLAYTASARDVSSVRNLRVTLLARFTLEQVKSACSEMYSKCGVILGEMTERNNSKLRTAKEAYVDDILEAMAKLDNIEDLPTFAVKSEDLKFIPRTMPEEADMLSLADRIGSLEEALSELRYDVNVKSAHKCNCQSDPAAREYMPPPVQNDIRRRSRRVSGNLTDKTSQSRDHSASSARRGPPAKQLMADLAKTFEKGDFPPLPKSRPKGSNKRPPPSKGNAKHEGASSEGSFKGSGPLTFKIVLTNVNKEADEDSIKDYIATQNEEITALEIEDTTTEGWPSKRFICKFKRCHMEQVLSPEFWPDEVYFRQWFTPRAKRSDL